MSNTVTFTIDGVEITAQPGETILAAAEKAVADVESAKEAKKAATAAKAAATKKANKEKAEAEANQ